MSSAYTDEQIDRYLEFISLPQKYHRKSNPPRDLRMLTALHTYQLSAIPYENLSLHYSTDHKVCLDPQHLYKKLTANGRGGYCMENSIFYNHILRGLGFQVYTSGVRIRERIVDVPHGDYIGWRHIVNIVTLPCGAKYMIDVGFGGDGATKPVPLHPSTPIVPNIGTQDIRLVHDTIPQLATHSLTNDHDRAPHKLWIYQYRNGPDMPWNAFYCFPEVEFLPEDFELVNYFVSTHPDSFQTRMVLVVKFLRGVVDRDGDGDEGDGEEGKEERIYGKRMMVGGTVKENLGGKTRVVRVCGSEKERVDVLEGFFGIRLGGEEREGIRGRVGELKGGV